MTAGKPRGKAKLESSRVAAAGGKTNKLRSLRLVGEMPSPVCHARRRLDFSREHKTTNRIKAFSPLSFYKRLTGAHLVDWTVARTRMIFLVCVNL